MPRTRLAPLSQRLCSRYVQVESRANRLHAARIGSYSGWPPLCCVRTASPTSRTIVVHGGLLPADFNGPHSSDIPKRYTGARDTTFARSARNNWIPKRDGYIYTYIHTYIQTISEMRRRISCLALRRSAITCTGLFLQCEAYIHCATLNYSTIISFSRG